MRIANRAGSLSVCLGLVFGFGVDAKGASHSAAPATLSGTVLDAVTLSPLPGVRIHYLYEWEMGPLDKNHFETSASDGSYRFSNLEPSAGSGQRYHLTVCAETYRCRYFTDTTGLLAGEEKRVDMMMEKDFSLTIRVSAAENPSNLLADVRIVVLLPLNGSHDQQMRSNMPWWYKVRTGRSDAVGQAGFKVTRWDTLQVTLAAPGFKTKMLTHAVRADAWKDTLSTALEKDETASTLSIHGSIIDQSGSAGGLQVLFKGTSAGKVFVLFGEAETRTYSIRGIPEDASGGDLSAVETIVSVDKDRFTDPPVLNTMRPVAASIQPYPGKTGKRKMTPSHLRSGGTGFRSMDVLGRSLPLNGSGRNLPLPFRIMHP